MPWVRGVIGSTRSSSEISSLDVNASKVACFRPADSDASFGIQVGDCDGDNGSRFLVQPAQLVLAKARWYREDHRAEVGDRKLERDVLPHVGQADSDNIAGLHASGAKETLEPAHMLEQLLEVDLAAVPHGGGVRTAPRVPVEIADRVVWLVHRIRAMIRSGVSGSVRSERDSASAMAFASAAVAPIVPPSPAPLVPSSWTVDGVTRCVIATDGTSLGLGMR